MDAELSRTLDELSPLIERALEQHFPQPSVAGADGLLDCMRYATFSGGRRMRPVLCILAGEACGAEREAMLPAAAAIEFLHTASLIYDDLPSMDDATLRRGAPPAHARYGQGVALLAGLSLVTHAFTLLADRPALVAAAAQAVGHAGMSAGQAIDLGGGARTPAHYLKTTALFRVAMTAGAVAGNADESLTNALESFGVSLGTAYQLMDDADDDYADGLRAHARMHLADARTALNPWLDRPAARQLCAYAGHLLAYVGVRE